MDTMCFPNRNAHQPSLKDYLLYYSHLSGQFDYLVFKFKALDDKKKSGRSWKTANFVA